MKILNIDDSTVNNMLMENLLAAHGFETLSVIEGNKAEEYIDEYQPDVIILDLMIPDKSGVEILKDFRAKKIDIPVIVITALESDDIRKEVECYGIKEFHTKPIDSARLIESIQKAANTC
ncbi:MAG: response regulator transcription factor [Bacteroidales bacterium]